jgi:hypothetical protein
MINDPIVEEVRKVRHDLFEQCGCDLAHFMEFLRASQAQHGDRLITSLEELDSRGRLFRGRKAELTEASDE